MKYSLNRWGILSTAVALFAAGVALWQLQSTHSSAVVPAGRDSLYAINLNGGSYIPPMTPRQRQISQRIGILDRAALEALDVGRYTQAEADARQASSLGPDSGIGQIALASALDAQGKTQEALHEYAVIAHQGYTSPRERLPYALLLLKTGHWSQAVMAYERTLPFPRTRPSAGETITVGENPDFSRGVPQKRELTAAIYTKLGIIDSNLDSWGGHSQADRALHEFKQALTLEPNSIAANFFYARELNRTGQDSEAKAIFRRITKITRGPVKTAAKEALRQ